MFEKAVRMKLRWQYKGMLGIEDLWDLSLADLDTIYMGLKAEEADAAGVESLLDMRTEADEVLTLKIAIVKHVFTVKKAEAEAVKNELDRARQKQKLLAILADKQDAELRDKTSDELTAMIEAL